MPKPLGYVLWRGLSPINRQPVVAIATLQSSNRKTGNMVQVWILDESMSPVDAVMTGADVSICGNCPHRKQSDGTRSCYVNVGQAPLSVWKSWKRGVYPNANDLTYEQVKNVFSGRKIRWGAYGDPGILPSHLVHFYNSLAIGWTGYTHQWRESFAKWSAGILMASCDSRQDYDDARSYGFHTFSVLAINATPSINAKQCPATVENSSAQCATCNLCNGHRADIYVAAHGSGAKHVTYA